MGAVQRQREQLPGACDDLEGTHAQPSRPKPQRLSRRRQIRSHLHLTHPQAAQNGQGVGGLTGTQDERVGPGSRDRGYGHRNGGVRGTGRQWWR